MSSIVISSSTSKQAKDGDKKKMNKKIIYIAIVSMFLLTGFTSFSAIGIESDVKTSGDELPDFVTIEITNISFVTEWLWYYIDFDITFKNNGPEYTGDISVEAFVDGERDGPVLTWCNRTFKEGQEYTRRFLCEEWPRDREQHELTFILDYGSGGMDGYLDGTNHGKIEESDEANNYIQITTQYENSLSRPHLPRFLGRFTILGRLLSLPILTKLIKI